jgi:hypothetical protein
MKNTLKQQLLALKWVTKTTGAIHEAQLRHLEAWFFGAMDLPPSGEQLKEFDSKVDVDGKRVLYSAKVSKKLSKKEIDPVRFQALDSWIKELLGSDWTYSVIINGQVRYDNTQASTRSKSQA